MPRDVRISRIIFALAVSVAIVASLAPSTHVMAAAAPAASKADPHACCKKDQQHPKKHSDSCDGKPCAMQCCRIIPAPADAAPRLVGRMTLVAVADILPSVLHSLTDPQAVFHPP